MARIKKTDNNKHDGEKREVLQYLKNASREKNTVSEMKSIGWNEQQNRLEETSSKLNT